MWSAGERDKLGILCTRRAGLLGWERAGAQSADARSHHTQRPRHKNSAPRRAQALLESFDKNPTPFTDDTHPAFVEPLTRAPSHPTCSPLLSRRERSLMRGARVLCHCAAETSQPDPLKIGFGSTPLEDNRHSRSLFTTQNFSPDTLIHMTT